MSSVQVGLRVGCQCIPTLAHNSTRTLRPCIIALAPNTDARLPVYFVLGLCEHLLEMSKLAVVYKKSEASSGKGVNMRCSITMFDMTAAGESVYSQLPAQFKTEVGELLTASAMAHYEHAHRPLRGQPSGQRARRRWQRVWLNWHHHQCERCCGENERGKSGSKNDGQWLRPLPNTGQQHRHHQKRSNGSHVW